MTSTRHGIHSNNELDGHSLELHSIDMENEEQETAVLKSDLMAKLNKEVKSLDDDSWMFEGPRSRIHLISGPGGLRHRRAEISARRDLAPQK